MQKHHRPKNFASLLSELASTSVSMVTMQKTATNFFFFAFWSTLCCYLDANDQKFKKNEGDTVNQLRKAIAVADMNLVQ